MNGNQQAPQNCGSNKIEAIWCCEYFSSFAFRWRDSGKNKRSKTDGSLISMHDFWTAM